MLHKTLTFINKEYVIPSDILKYIELMSFTNKIKDDLM